MDGTAYYRYDAVRYFPQVSSHCPFQILGSSPSSIDVPATAVTKLSLEEAKALHHALGTLIGAKDE